MKYQEAIAQSMKDLAEDEKTVFLGYNIKFGSNAYETLRDIPKERKIETPVAENLMIGMALGLSVEGYKPVVFFERHDFMLNALDSIINHLDKVSSLSQGEFQTPVIIRATIGSKYPLKPGIQHTQDFTEAFKKMIKFPILTPETPLEVLGAYKLAKEMKGPVMIIEKKDLYNKEQIFEQIEENEKKKEKVLVTGGAGYVGSVLVPRLIEEGYDVRVLDSMLFGKIGLESVKDKCEIIEGDIRDKDVLDKSLDNVDHVIHLAAISNDPCSDLDPELTKQVNFESTKKPNRIIEEKRC